MSDNDNDDGGTSTGIRLLLSAGIVVLAIPGLIIEPGPFSEAAALAALMAIWGFEGGDA